MKVLFDERWLTTPEVHPPDVTPERISEFLSPQRTAVRIQSALQRTFVWATIEVFGDRVLAVHDVRILDTLDSSATAEQVLLVAREFQVEVLEGWRTPQRVWTDEANIEIIEGIQ